MVKKLSKRKQGDNNESREPSVSSNEKGHHPCLVCFALYKKRRLVSETNGSPCYSRDEARSIIENSKKTGQTGYYDENKGIQSYIKIYVMGEMISGYDIDTMYRDDVFHDRWDYFVDEFLNGKKMFVCHGCKGSFENYKQKEMRL